MEKPYGPRLIIYLLLGLMFLHGLWTILIIKTIYKTLKTGQAADIRSDDDETEYKQLKIKQKKTRKKFM